MKTTFVHLEAQVSLLKHSRMHINLSVTNNVVKSFKSVPTFYGMPLQAPARKNTKVTTDEISN